MRNFSKLGATALALALSITMVAPISANAAEDRHYGNFADTSYDYDSNGAYERNADGSIKTDEDGDPIFDEKTSTYKNKVTGDTYTYNYETHTESGDYSKATRTWFGNPKKLTVGTKSYCKFTLFADPGETFDGKVKIKSGKGNITLKQVGKSEEEVVPEYDYESKQYVFTKKDGTKEAVGASLTLDQRYAMKRTKCSYTFIITGKKVGSAKLQYKINGKKYKITVTVTDDIRPFKSITYAGKSLQQDYNAGATNANFYAKQNSNKQGIWYVSKKSGKFKVTMNKGYKFVATYVVKDTEYETKTNEYGSSISRAKTFGIDINGDGDFEDTIDGIKESSYKNKEYKKYSKKNAKIKLSTSVDRTDTNKTYGTAPYTTKNVETYKGNIADTTILIVFQDKNTKKFGVEPITLNYSKASKK